MKTERRKALLVAFTLAAMLVVFDATVFADEDDMIIDCTEVIDWFIVYVGNWIACWSAFGWDRCLRCV